jgi:hypothetical protein
MARFMIPSSQKLPPGESDVHYFVRLGENEDLALLQESINLYLFQLESPALPQFALIETQHGNYISTAGPPTIIHTVMMTFMWVGGPVDFVPPSISPP